MRISWEIKSFFAVVGISIIMNILYFGVCGALFLLVDFSFQGFMTGIMVGLVFGLPLPLMAIINIIQSFLMIFEK